MLPSIYILLLASFGGFPQGGWNDNSSKALIAFAIHTQSISGISFLAVKIGDKWGQWGGYWDTFVESTGLSWTPLLNSWTLILLSSGWTGAPRGHRAMARISRLRKECSLQCLQCLQQFNASQIMARCPSNTMVMLNPSPEPPFLEAFL